MWTAARDDALAFLACAITASLACLLGEHFVPANIVMLFLLAVVLVAVRFGRGPAVIAAFLSVALFDFFLVPPRYSFAVNDMQYLLTFAVMLAVALITGQLTAGLKGQADLASLRERRVLALYEMSRELAGALELSQVTAIAREFLRNGVKASASFVIVDRDGKLEPADAFDADAPVVNEHMARPALENGECADLAAPHPLG